MNPFRRLWTRELGLYVTALALLAQILMAVGHAVPAHAGQLDHAVFCVVDTGGSQDATIVAQACPLCQIPDPQALKPRDPSLTVALEWTQIVYAISSAQTPVRVDYAAPLARGPPLPV